MCLQCQGCVVCGKPCLFGGHSSGVERGAVLRDRYVVVDNFVPRELAARMRAEAHALQRQGKQSPPCSPGD